METTLCRDLGGGCDQSLSAKSWDVMAGVMSKHVTESHQNNATGVYDRTSV